MIAWVSSTFIGIRGFVRRIRSWTQKAHPKKNYKQLCCDVGPTIVNEGAEHISLGVTGFCCVNGKTAQGKAVYAKVRSILGK